ncbi:protein of unknown function (plasmid) [Denitratisoma oestradiolicum]|uniref:Uncharacterized protein n=1 Tax=Denitratisoma oestradiolicum TaxID=311182 RepID=A0A6S6Y1J7_9PROT|nr:protein of unknown function [Denitratisoma oestradiolicum]CAB1371240.1 protein of unknown function [Denitratisoma oestradiolicum]CAB1371259.1 protein of unknown function [Denitratisoma oestradiolicum]
MDLNPWCAGAGALNPLRAGPHCTAPFALIRRHGALRPGFSGQGPGCALKSSPVRCSPAAALRVRLPVSPLTAPVLRAPGRRGDR